MEEKILNKQTIDIIKRIDFFSEMLFKKVFNFVPRNDFGKKIISKLKNIESIQKEFYLFDYISTLEYYFDKLEKKNKKIYPIFSKNIPNYIL